MTFVHPLLHQLVCNAVTKKGQPCQKRVRWCATYLAAATSPSDMRQRERTYLCGTHARSLASIPADASQIVVDEYPATILERRR